MRKFALLVIALSLLYFIVGWILVKWGVLSREDYFAYAGIVGSFVSLVSLVSFLRPAITQSDFQSIEVQTLRSVAETAEELKVLQSARSRTAEELDNRCAFRTRR